jgi:hypothetical protein
LDHQKAAGTTMHPEQEKEDINIVVKAGLAKRLQ